MGRRAVGAVLGRRVCGATDGCPRAESRPYSRGVPEPDEPSVADLAATITGADEARRQPPQPVESRAQQRKRAREAGCWFMPKSWGGGWAAVSWQGYVVAALAGLLTVGSLLTLTRPAAFVSMTLVVAATLFIAEAKGRPTRQSGPE